MNDQCRTRLESNYCSKIHDFCCGSISQAYKVKSDIRILSITHFRHKTAPSARKVVSALDVPMESPYGFIPVDRFADQKTPHKRLKDFSSLIRRSGLTKQPMWD